MRKLKKELKKLQQYKQMIEELFSMGIITMNDNFRISAKLIDKRKEIEQEIINKNKGV